MDSGNSNHLDHVEHLDLLDVRKHQVPRERRYEVEDEHSLYVLERNQLPVCDLFTIFVANRRVKNDEHIDEKDNI